MKIIKKIDFKHIIKASRVTFQHFCENTYIHAFQYISTVPQSTLKLIDYIFWTIVILIMLVFSIFGCDLFLERFNANGIKNYISTDYKSIHFIPLPAITVCPIEKINSYKLEMIIKQNNLESVNLTLLRESLNYFDFNAFKNNDPISDEHVNVISTLRNATKLGIRELLKLVAYDCNELLVKCKWEGVITSCGKLFKMLATYEGFCCSFNYDGRHSPDSLPIKTKYFGITNGLSFAINIPKLKTRTSSNHRLMKILIHQYRSYASYIVPELIIAPNTENIIYLSPQITIANDEVKALSIPSRNCYLKTEKQLNYFEVYTFTNCLAECLMNQIYSLCSCIPPFSPSYLNLTVCDENAINCFRENIDTVLERFKKDECDCLQTCNKLSYQFNLITTKFVSPKYTLDLFYKNLTKADTVVHVTNAKQTMRITRSELSLNWIQLIANVGGIVSLFTGVSLVSLAHFLYTFSIKWIINIRKEYKSRDIIIKRVRFGRS